MRFEDFTQDEFQKEFVKRGWELDSIQWFLSEIESEQLIPIWFVSGRLRWKNRVITIQGRKIIESYDDGNTREIGANIVINSPSALNLSEKGISLG